MLQRSRGFTVAFSGLEDDNPHDLLLRRDEIEAEVACDVVTAEEGRGVHRGAWFRLADRIDPDLQTWLAAHPGRYLLKMTLPLGLRGRPARQRTRQRDIGPAASANSDDAGNAGRAGPR